MKINVGLALIVFAVALRAQPQFTKDNRLIRPSDYREWVYLTSGLGMAYSEAAQNQPNPPFDNVFVNPASYRSFLETGKWPDKTMFILEVRASARKKSIDHQGSSQGEIVALEASVKDEARFPEKWAYFAFGDASTAQAFSKAARCYPCHNQNGAVDNTFTQFYPTLFEVAKRKGTVRSSYKP